MKIISKNTIKNLTSTLMCLSFIASTIISSFLSITLPVYASVSSNVTGLSSSPSEMSAKADTKKISVS